MTKPTKGVKARRFTNSQYCDHRRNPVALVASVETMQDGRVDRMTIATSTAASIFDLNSWLPRQFCDLLCASGRR
jgi:hypothetical protein